MLRLDDTVFVLVDVQGKLAQIMADRQRLFEKLEKLVRGVRALKVPVLWAEQNPGKMGPTIDELQTLLKGLEPLAKMSFGCCGHRPFVEALERLERRHVLVAGIEAHVCVYQTATGLGAMGYDVEVVADAVSSRETFSRDIALRRLVQEGVRLTTVEMALFELMGTADHEAFRELLKIVK